MATCLKEQKLRVFSSRSITQEFINKITQAKILVQCTPEAKSTIWTLKAKRIKKFIHKPRAVSVPDNQDKLFCKIRTHSCKTNLNSRHTMDRRTTLISKLLLKTMVWWVHNTSMTSMGCLPLRTSSHRHPISQHLRLLIMTKQFPTFQRESQTVNWQLTNRRSVLRNINHNSRQL